MEEKETDSEQTKKRSGVSRREFIAGTVGGVVVGAVVGAAAGSLGFPKTVTQTVTQALTQTQTVTATSTSVLGVPSTWDYTADVVVMGSGAAGLSAAIEATTAGAKVILLEKAPSYTDANSGHCGGTLVGAGTSYQAALGITDSADAFYNELVATSDPRCSPGLMKLLADNSAAAIDFLTKQGITWQPYCPLLGNSSSTPSTAPRLMACMPDSTNYPATLTKSALNLGVTILYNSPVTSLIRHPTNGVVGVQALKGVTATPGTGLGYSGGTVIYVKASRAVILAAGDAGGNPNFLGMFAEPGWYTTLPTGGNTDNTGDGIIEAMAVGAAPMCLDQSATSPSFSFLVGNYTGSPDTKYGYPNVTTGPYKYQPTLLWYAIYVNNAGQRYTNEQGGTVGADSYKQPAKTGFLICDSQPAKANVLVHTSAGHTYFQDWVSAGTLKSYDSIADLATAMGIDPTGLAATITKYNGYCTAQKDSDFNRPSPTLGPGISVAPFYAAKGFMTRGSTFAGTLEVSFPTLQVMDEEGNLIPRLYAAGDCGHGGFMAGGIGTHMCWTIVSGRVCGDNAAATAPWS